VDDILGITLQLARVCDRLGLRYVVGGSLASSLHRIPRATQDVDVVVALEQRDVPQFVEALGGDFYLDQDAIRDAVARRTSFNLIHLGSYFKADVFVARDDEPTHSQFSRSRAYAIGTEGAGELVVASPEDVVAQKLHWFALGDRVSERQWIDALGVIKVTGSRLDWEYLRSVCALLGVGELLEEAGRAVGSARSPDIRAGDTPS
jgi:hypothetical protein